MDTHERLAKYKLQDKLPDGWLRVEGYGAHIACPMKNLVDDTVCGWQDRYINPAPGDLKSRTRRGTKVGWFYGNIDILEPVIILEGEKDYLTAWQLEWNCIGMQGVGNLNKTVDLLTKRGVKQIILLVDNDEAANGSIKKIQNRIPVYDGRYVLGDQKDTNDAWVAGILKKPETLASNNLFVKLGPYKIKRTMNPLPDRSIDFLSIDSAMILQNLYPQYQVRGDRIYENGKILDGYRYWKTKNAVVDFSGKDRPQGNAWSIAFSYYHDKKQTSEYLKRYS